MSFKIGDVEIKGKVILAPMAGITSFSYRKFMMPFGVALSYTEMISDCALIYGNHETYKLLDSDGCDRPLAVQLFGGSKETLLKGLDLLNKSGCKYDILDLNLGCPVPKVTRSNGGSSWLIDQTKLFDMVSAVVKASTKPVSCKIRLGFNTVNVNETVVTLEKAGVKFIAIHARTKKELYMGEPHYDMLKDIHNLIHIPFAISGNIYTVEDALKALEITKADAVMVARGAEGNPELISNLNKAFNGEKYDENKDFLRQANYALTYVNYMMDEFEEIVAVRMLRGILPHFFDGISGTKPMKNELCTLTNSKDDIVNIINKYIDEYNKTKVV
jgi:tRNA-dihydrouridine synthase B